MNSTRFSKGAKGASLALALALSAAGAVAVAAPAHATGSAVAVHASDIRPNENTYPGWHQGYADAGADSYSITSEGLKLSGKSQIIDGFETAARPTGTQLESMITDGQVSWTTTAGSDVAYFQLPIFYGAAQSFTTLRPAAPVAGKNTVAFDQNWVSSKAITAAAGGTDVAANTPTPLQDILTALDVNTVNVLGFGVLTVPGATSVVTGISFNGTDYTFSQDPLTAGTVTVSGDAKVGSTLTASVDGWPTGATLSYQWFVTTGQSGGPIGEPTTSSTYVLTDAEVGFQVGVIVTATKDGFAKADATSNVTGWVTAPQKAPAAAPVPNSDALPQYLAAHEVTVADPAAAGLPATLDASKGYTATLTWNAHDSFVDVYAYSTPVFVGTFPVVNGAVQITLTPELLAKIGAGAHALVATGQSSGAVQAVSFSVTAAAATPAGTLANTGSEIAFPMGAAALLLIVGAALIVARRRQAARV